MDKSEMGTASQARTEPSHAMRSERGEGRRWI